MLPFGFKFKWKAEEILSIMDKAKIITEFAKVGFGIDPETVTEEVGIKIEDFIAPPSPGQPVALSTIMNDVRDLYKPFLG